MFDKLASISDLIPFCTIASGAMDIATLTAGQLRPADPRRILLVIALQAGPVNDFFIRPNLPPQNVGNNVWAGMQIKDTSGMLRMSYLDWYTFPAAEWFFDNQAGAVGLTWVELLWQPR